jgi:hypothetical protein
MPATMLTMVTVRCVRESFFTVDWVIPKGLLDPTLQHCWNGRQLQNKRRWHCLLIVLTIGEFHDQADFEWVKIRGPLMIRPAGGQPPTDRSASRGLAILRAYFDVFSYYQLVMLFFNIVRLIIELTTACVLLRWRVGRRQKVLHLMRCAPEESHSMR